VTITPLETTDLLNGFLQLAGLNVLAGLAALALAIGWAALFDGGSFGRDRQHRQTAAW
jgi:hypothetical protein